MGRVAGITLAVLVHAAVLLFGGLLFLKSPESPAPAPAEMVDLVQEDQAKDKEAEKEEKSSEETAETTEKEEPMQEADEMPDLKELAALDAAAAAPALDAVSLDALEDLLAPGDVGGGADFYSASSDLASGGRIGGTGKALADEGSDDVFSIMDIDEKPRPLQQAMPAYPLELRRRKIEGSVQVLFIVDEQGRVVSPKVERSSSPEFERPALEAVRQWRFEPAVKNGKKVQCKMRVPVRFSIG